MNIRRWYCDRAQRKGVYPRTQLVNDVETAIVVFFLIVAIAAMIIGPIERTPIYGEYP